MPLDVSTEAVIGRPVEEVATYVADPDNAPRWYVNIKAIEWLTPRPLQVGSRVVFSASFLGRRLTYTYEIVELVPGRRLVMRTTEGPFPMETAYTWQPDGPDRTRMTLRNRGGPGGYARWLAPLMAFAVRRANRKDLALLKKNLEGAG